MKFLTVLAALIITCLVCEVSGDLRGDKYVRRATGETREYRILKGAKDNEDVVRMKRPKSAGKMNNKTSKTGKSGKSSKSSKGFTSPEDSDFEQEPIIVDPPTDAPVDPPTDPPVNPPTDPPVDPPTNPPTDSPVNAPTNPPDPTASPATPSPTPQPTTMPPTSPTTEEPVEVTIPATQVTVTIVRHALQDGDEFLDLDSYQTKALLYTNTVEGIDAMPDGKVMQYYALACIWYATNGVRTTITDAFIPGNMDVPGWTRTDNWLSTSVDPCNGWFGVTCDDDSKVTDIVMENNFMTGSFPPEVTLLASSGPTSTGAGNLIQLDLFDNGMLYNNHDTSWVANLGDNMAYLFYGDTSFSGTIPIELSLLPNLEEFDCAYTFTTGPLSFAPFAGLSNLFYLALEGNAFNSSVPGGFATLPNLENFYLGDSFLSGDLSYMEGMPAIYDHWVDLNPGLGGPIYSFIGQLTTLVSLSVTDNAHTGTLPTELGLLTDIEQMWFYGNELTGVIPSEIGNLGLLETFQVEDNDLVGPMPDEVCLNRAGSLLILGADCGEVDCFGTYSICCTCCNRAECGDDLPTDPPTGPPVGSPTLAASPTTEEPITVTIPATPATFTIFRNALQEGDEFLDLDSYQTQALLYTNTVTGINAMPDGKIMQYYALACLWYATNGVRSMITDSFLGGAVSVPGWRRTDNWLSTSVDPCNGWFGVTCDDDGKVTDIVMENNLMTGSFPPEVTLLASSGPTSTGAGNLNQLDLFDNAMLYNNHDMSWVANLGDNMSFLFFGDTSFSGTIPIELSLLPNLEEFDCSYTYITGPLSFAPFAGLSNLFYLALEGNAFNSSVPGGFATLPNLENLYLGDSFLSGDLSYMEGMPAIYDHWVDMNPGLGGPIYSFIGQLTTLVSLSVTDNAHTGTLPTELGRLTNMEQMWFYGNELTGVIPSEIGNLGLLDTFQVEDNDLVGTMPDEVCLNRAGSLSILGADCGEVDCFGTYSICCTCCNRAECDDD